MGILLPVLMLTYMMRYPNPPPYRNSISGPNRKHRLNSWEWEPEWEWWTGKGREMEIAVWKKFPLVALIIFLALYCRLARWIVCYFFITILRALAVLWLTRVLACLYFVADILSLRLALHITILIIWHWTVFDAFMFFGSGSGGNGTK